MSKMGGSKVPKSHTLTSLGFVSSTRVKHTTSTSSSQKEKREPSKEPKSHTLTSLGFVSSARGKHTTSTSSAETGTRGVTSFKSASWNGSTTSGKRKVEDEDDVEGNMVRPQKMSIMTGRSGRIPLGSLPVPFPNAKDDAKSIDSSASSANDVRYKSDTRVDINAAQPPESAFDDAFDFDGDFPNATSMKQTSYQSDKIHTSFTSSTETETWSVTSLKGASWNGRTTTGKRTVEDEDESKITYDMDVVRRLQAQCSHIAPVDWDCDSVRYNPALIEIWKAWIDFLDQSRLEERPVKDGQILRIVPPCMPWYTPDQNIRLIALVMHYLTIKETRRYTADNHTSNYLHTKEGSSQEGPLVSTCWQLIRQSVGDEGYFTNCVKVEAYPFAFPYGGKPEDVFQKVDEDEIMTEYAKFIKVVINAVDKVHLCSKTVKEKVHSFFGGERAFNSFFNENRTRFFSLLHDKYETCYHPERFLAPKYLKVMTPDVARDWDVMYTDIRKYLQYDLSDCTECSDISKKNEGTLGYDLMKQKQKEQHEESRIRQLELGAKGMHNKQIASREGRHNWALAAQRGMHPSHLDGLRGQHPQQISSRNGTHNISLLSKAGKHPAQVKNKEAWNNVDLDLASKADAVALIEGCNRQLRRGISYTTVIPPQNSTINAIIPTSLDVLWGVGKRANDHPGNKRFYRVCEEIKNQYMCKCTT